MFDRDFTKSLMIRDFDDLLKNPFGYVHLFLLLTILSKTFSKIAMDDLQKRVQSLHNLLENIIFDFQITIHRVHPVLSVKSSDSSSLGSLKISKHHFLTPDPL